MKFYWNTAMHIHLYIIYDYYILNGFCVNFFRQLEKEVLNFRL